MTECRCRVAKLASVAQERPLTRAVEKGPQIVASAVVLTRIRAAVIRARTTHFDADAGQMEHVASRFARRGRLLRTAGNDPLAIDDDVLHTADEKRQSLGQDPEERSGSAQHSHSKTRFRRIDGLDRIDGVHGFL